MPAARQLLTSDMARRACLALLMPMAAATEWQFSTEDPSATYNFMAIGGETQ